MKSKTSNLIRPATLHGSAAQDRHGAGWILVAMALLVAAGFCSAMAQTSDPPNSRDFTAFKIINERNIFDPNRRPHYSSGPAEKIVDSFVLTGTMSYAKGSFAVFDGTGSDYRKVLEPGGTIAGYTVTNIAPDSVKLFSGSNVLELKVGMQMRRNDDGQWSVGESEWSGSTSYASNSSRRRDGRRSSSRYRRSEGGRTDSLSTEATPGTSDTTEGTDAADSSEPEMTNAPPDAAGGDLNDPVARMMRRRAQELNGNDNRNSNQ